MGGQEQDTDDVDVDTSYDSSCFEESDEDHDEESDIGPFLPDVVRDGPKKIEDSMDWAMANQDAMATMSLNAGFSLASMVEELSHKKFYIFSFFTGTGTGEVGCVRALEAMFESHGVDPYAVDIQVYSTCEKDPTCEDIQK